MLSTLRALALGATLSFGATNALAVTTEPFDTPLSAGDNTMGSAMADAFESFLGTTLSFIAATDLLATVTIAINPFLFSPQGTASNDIGISYSINGGADTELDILSNPIFPIGAAGTDLLLDAGDQVAFSVTGSAGPSGNQVTFNVETENPQVAILPIMSSGLLILTGLGAFAFMQRRQT